MPHGKPWWGQWFQKVRSINHANSLQQVQKPKSGEFEADQFSVIVPANAMINWESQQFDWVCGHFDTWQGSEELLGSWGLASLSCSLFELNHIPENALSPSLWPGRDLFNEPQVSSAKIVVFFAWSRSFTSIRKRYVYPGRQSPAGRRERWAACGTPRPWFSHTEILG